MNGDYASSPGYKTMEDINKFVIPIITETEITHLKKDIMINFKDRHDKEELLNELSKLSYDNKSAALFRLAIPVLAKQKPRYLFNKNRYVSIQPTEASKYNADLHHFIPKKSNFVKKYNFCKKDLDSLGNIALINSDENRIEIGNKDPEDYIKKSKHVYKDNFSKLLESHMIEKEDLKNITEISNLKSLEIHDNVASFLRKRMETIRDEVFECFIKI